MSSRIKLIFFVVFGLLIGWQVKSEEFDKITCDNSNMKACGNLVAMEYKKGHFVEAGIIAKKMCDSGEMSGCTSLATIERKKGNFEEALVLFKKACDGGEMKACNAFGFEEYKKGHFNEANLALNKACEANMMDACYNQGAHELEKGNPTKGIVLLKKACDAGQRNSCLVLGAVERAKGNIATATVLFKKACDSGVQKGCEVLAEIAAKSLALGKKFESQTLKFEIPKDWECYFKQSDWICKNLDKAKSVDILLTFTVLKDEKKYTLEMYESYFKQSQKSTVVNVKEINGLRWVESQNSIPPVYTSHIFVTLKNEKSIFVAFMVKKDRLSLNQNIIGQIISSLSVKAEMEGISKAPAGMNIIQFQENTTYDLLRNELQVKK